MEKKAYFVLIFSVCLLFILINPVFAGEQWPKSDKEYGDFQKRQLVGNFLWICPVIATGGQSDKDGATPIVWPGDYVFEVKGDGGELSKKLLAELKEFGHGGLLIPNAKFQGNKRRALAYRKVVITDTTMTISRGDGRQMMIEPKADYFRRVLYPVEPTKENDWSGWPKLKE